MRFLLAIITAVAIAAPAEAHNFTCRAENGSICSRAFAATGDCTAQDVMPIVETPWEERAIEIVGVSVWIKLYAEPDGLWRRITGHQNRPTLWAFAGNSAEPDVMLVVNGEGATTTMYPNGAYFPFPGKGDDAHVDLHVTCHDAKRFATTMVVFYRFAK